MIDLPTQKDIASPHHKRAIWSLIASVVIFGILLAFYYMDSLKVITESLPGVQQAEQWTASDTQQKQVILDSISTRVTETLAPAALKEKQRILDTIAR